MIDAPDGPPDLAAWIARDEEGLLTFRYRTTGARAALRLPRAGVLVDGPALAASEESGLTPDELVQGRLLLLWPDGRTRETVLLQHLERDELVSLDARRLYALHLHRDELHAWFELTPPPVGAPADEELPPTSVRMAPEPIEPEDDLVRHLRAALARERKRAYALEQRVDQLEAELRRMALAEE